MKNKCIHRKYKVTLYICVILTALWATRLTEDVADDPIKYAHTILRELIVYAVFLVILCVSKFLIFTCYHLLQIN